jgi:hypothetical protein
MDGEELEAEGIFMREGQEEEEEEKLGEVGERQRQEEEGRSERQRRRYPGEVRWQLSRTTLGLQWTRRTRWS